MRIIKEKCLYRHKAYKCITTPKCVDELKLEQMQEKQSEHAVNPQTATRAILKKKRTYMKKPTHANKKQHKKTIQLQRRNHIIQ